jgi:long-chain acyl-CoA synthetase
MPSVVMPQSLKQQNDHLSPVNQARRLSVIRGPSHPPLMNITLGELTRRQSRKHANRVAIVSQHQNEVLSYSQLHKYSDDLAAGMISQGVERGDRVAVMLGNRSEYVHVRMSIYLFLCPLQLAIKNTNTIVQLLLACAKIGAIITLLNYAYSHAEIISALSTTSEPSLTQSTLNMLTKNSLQDRKCFLPLLGHASTTIDHA